MKTTTTLKLLTAVSLVSAALTAHAETFPSHGRFGTRDNGNVQASARHPAPLPPAVVPAVHRPVARTVNHVPAIDYDEHMSSKQG